MTLRLHLVNVHSENRHLEKSDWLKLQSVKTQDSNTRPVISA